MKSTSSNWKGVKDSGYIQRRCTRKNGIQWTLWKQLDDLDFADDISLLSHTKQQMKTKNDNLSSEAKKTGLNININKTKVMKINTQNESPIQLANEALEEVQEFTYLGSTITTEGGADKDVTRRIGMARNAYNTLKPIWNSSSISTKTKLRIFNSNVKSVLLYGSETWKTTKEISNKLQTFINKCLHQILQIRWPQKIRNTDLWERTGQIEITKEIGKRKWSWIGHTLRKPTTNVTRQALEWNPAGKRKRGRPRKTWRRTIEEEMRAKNITWQELKKTAQNRVRWRSVADALCSTRSEVD